MTEDIQRIIDEKTQVLENRRGEKARLELESRQVGLQDQTDLTRISALATQIAQLESEIASLKAN